MADQHVDKKRPTTETEEASPQKVQKVENGDVSTGQQTKKGNCPLCKRVGMATLTKCDSPECGRFACNKCRFLCAGKYCGEKYCKKCSTVKCVICTAEFCFDCAHDEECCYNPCKVCDEPHCAYCDCPSKSDEEYNCSGDYDDAESASDSEDSGSD